jgi:hypothetical protein
LRYCVKYLIRKVLPLPGVPFNICNPIDYLIKISIFLICSLLSIPVTKEEGARDEPRLDLTKKGSRDY